MLFEFRVTVENLFMYLNPVLHPTWNTTAANFVKCILSGGLFAVFSTRNTLFIFMHSISCNAVRAKKRAVTAIRYQTNREKD